MWFKNGTKIFSGESLIVNNLSANERGNYTAYMENIAGIAIINYIVFVSCKYNFDKN